MFDNLSYNPNTGEFLWIRSPGNQVPDGGVAGSLSARGYRYIEIGGKSYSAHRLAWFIFYGAMPIDQIDHINGKRDDNRIVNLRLSTNQQNQWNAKARRRVPGLKGTTKYSPTKWTASIWANKKRHHLGIFNSEKKAHEAYCIAAREHFGKFANTGEDK